ncbi:MAG: hypothetical protein DRH43_11005 [Deltaproteobacteria bacterium]|nr:MAG: hypothetical protein DRH43_11005 [Deltaproteobacteria bacterium]
MDNLTFKLIPRGEQKSGYDWLNIDCEDARVGRVRCTIDDRTLTIYSINIFPEFEKQGYAKATINLFKEHFDTIIADRVRYTAIGFWKKMGFVDQHDGTFVYGKSLTLENMERGEVSHRLNTGQVSKRMESF